MYNNTFCNIYLIPSHASVFLMHFDMLIPEIASNFENNEVLLVPMPVDVFKITDFCSFSYFT